MKNRDAMAAQFRAELQDAIDSGDTSKVAEAFAAFAAQVQEDTIADAQSYRETGDREILARRGVRVLTSDEEAYYGKLGKAMSAVDPKSAIANLDQDMPQTIIDAVSADVIKQFPILDAVDFQTTKYLTRWFYNTKGVQYAAWGALGSKITKELEGSIAYLEITHNKLSAFMPISIDMVNEGPAWLDSYIRAVLTEAMGAEMSRSVICGSGNGEPVGMVKDLDAAVTGGVYSDKAAAKVTDFGVKTMATLNAKLAVDVTGRPRAVGETILVVNPQDYYKYVVPATTLMTSTGQYVGDVFPVAVRVIQDINVPAGKAVYGLGKQYLLALGSLGKMGNIETSDEYQFLEDNRVYKVKAYGNGRPKDNVSFLVLDITGVKALKYTVSTTAE